MKDAGHQFMITKPDGQQVCVSMGADESCPLCLEACTPDQLERASLVVLTGPKQDVFIHAACLNRYYRHGEQDKAARAVAADYALRNWNP